MILIANKPSVANLHLVVSEDMMEGDWKSNTVEKDENKKKQRPAYFKSTLDSHWKIHKISLFKRKTKSNYKYRKLNFIKPCNMDEVVYFKLLLRKIKLK